MQKIFENLNLYKNFQFRKLAVKLFNNPNIVNSYPFRALHKIAIKKRIKNFNYTSPCIQVELTTSCNANCIMCPHDMLSRKKGVMSMQLFKQIVDEAVEWNVPLLQLCGFGETLLDQQIVKRIRYAKQRGIRDIRINTNGSLLTRELSDELIQSELDEILISVDHGNKAEYEAIRKGLSFEGLISNINYIVENRKKQGKTIPRIGINAVAQDINMENVNAVHKAFKDRVDYIVFQAAWNWTGTIDIESPLTSRKKKRFPCPYLWAFLNIRWDGDVTICCVDYDNKVVVGNVKDNGGLKGVWFNAKYDRLRKLHLQKKFSQIPTCGSCNNFANWWIRN